MWSAAAEFNLPGALSDASDNSGGHVGGGAPSALPTALRTASDRFYNHPGFALGVLVIGTAGLAAYASKPIAGGRVSAHVGPAKGEIAGEI